MPQQSFGLRENKIDDFETFYMSNTGILAARCGQGIYGSFLPVFSEYLRELGYQRVFNQHKPDNTAIYGAKMKHGFLIAVTENHERWGQLTKLMKSFNRQREAIMLPNKTTP